MKGKPWTVEEEKQLREMILAHKALSVIAVSLGKTKESIRCKVSRLGLVDDNQPIAEWSSTTKLKLPKELPSVEEALKILAAALKASCKSGLGKVEVQRLQAVATLARTYKELLADYIDYRGIEAELLEMKEKYAELAKKVQGAAG